MTTIQKTIVAALVAGAIGVAIFEVQDKHNLQKQVQTLNAEKEQNVALKAKVVQLEKERDETRAAVASQPLAPARNSNEVLKLRGEVGRLRQENAQMGSTNVLSKATATPEARKLLRDAQKGGMAVIYKEFAKQAGLNKEQTEKLNDLLADHIMANVDHVTASLRDKLPLDQVKARLATQDGVLQQQLEDLAGHDAAAQYQDYSKDLIASLSAMQFKGKLSGTDAEKDQKSEQLKQLLKQQVASARAQYGLADDYQMVPMLNFANIASEEQGEQSLNLLDGIYKSTADGAGSFLSAEEIEKFHEFTAVALSNSRGALSMNRAFMAPYSN
jgi:hypothetical protein